VAAVNDLAQRDRSVIPELHLALCAWALDELVPDRDAPPWPSVHAWAEHFPRGGSNVALATGAVAQIRINALKLAEDLVTQIGAVANPTDACILMWLVTVAINRLSHELSKDDSTLQVLIRRRTELIERLSAEIDDYSFRDSANDAQDDVDADVVSLPTTNLSASRP